MTSRLIAAGAFGLALWTLSSVSTSGQAKRPMTLVDLAELPRIVNPQLSPNGKSIIYQQSHADWKADRPVWNTWRRDLGGSATQLTFSEGGDINPPGCLRWSPDGKTILFVRSSPAPQIWLLPADGGEPSALTRHSTGVYPATPPMWAPDSKSIYFVAEEPRTAAERDRDAARDDVFAFEENYRQRHIWNVVVSTGAERQITSGDFNVNTYRLSHDGSRIAFERAPSPLIADKPRAEVWVIDADGQHGRPVTHNGIDEVDPELSPDNRTVLFLADANARQEPYYTTNVFVVPAAGGTPQLIVPDFPYSIDQATWMPDGKNVLAAVNMGVHSEVFLLDVDAHRARQLTDGRHFITPGSLSIVPAAETIVMQLDEPTRFGDVWTLPLRGASPARPPTRVTDLFDRMEREVALPRQEKVEWKSTDGTTIEGVLFYPIDYVPGRRYPLIVQMHGGPGDSDKFGAGVGLLDRYFPVSTAKGYAVLRPNYRGSSGYGNAFYRAIIGDYFTRQAEDILSGIDHLVQAGVVDPDRLIATGWSAGGHLTNKLITMTSRFKAASSGAGVANWISLYAQTDTRVDRTVWFGGTPWQKDAPIAAYWNNSPLKDVANVRTPTLFFVGESDPRVPKEQSIEMYRALKSNGVPTVLYIAPHEPHQWGGLHHLLDKANHELEWFDKYALGRAYLPEKAPDKK